MADTNQATSLFGMQTEACPRGEMTIFFLCDISGSMAGTKIGALNDAMRNVIPLIQEISDSNPTTEIKLAAMTFSTDTQWLYPEQKSSDVFEWIDQTASGMTSLGKACDDLEKVLHISTGWMPAHAAKAPVFILISDGEPNDDYEGGLKKLHANPWFKTGIKFAIAVGDDVNIETLEKFTGTKNEGIIYTNNIEALKTVIRIVSVASSRIGSRNVSANAGATLSKQSEVQELVQQELSNSDIDGISYGSRDGFGGGEWD